MTMTAIRVLIPACNTMDRRRRCDRCHRPFTDFVFRPVANGSRWQRRCRRCAEKMVSEGTAVYKESAQ